MALTRKASGAGGAGAASSVRCQVGVPFGVAWPGRMGHGSGGGPGSWEWQGLGPKNPPPPVGVARRRNQRGTAAPSRTGRSRGSRVRITVPSEGWSSARWPGAHWDGWSSCGRRPRVAHPKAVRRNDRPHRKELRVRAGKRPAGGSSQREGPLVMQHRCDVRIAGDTGPTRMVLRSVDRRRL